MSTTNLGASDRAVRRAVALAPVLVRVPSVNPDDGEAGMVEVISAWLGRHTAAELTVVPSMPGRPSLAAVVRGGHPGPTLVLNGHTDTVPTGDPTAWADHPLSGEVRDGWIFGRGACDMKAGLAVAMAVLEHASRCAASLAGTLVVHFAAGEERGEVGTESLLAAGFGGDVAIVLEPTCLGVATAGRGLATYDVTVTGRGGHAGAQETAGRNPVDGVAAVIAACRAHPGVREHPLLGVGRCTPTALRAGLAPNAVPEHAHVTIDRRLLPGEPVDADAARLAEAIAIGLPDALSSELSVRAGAFPPVELPDGRFAAAVRGQVAEHTGVVPPRWAAPYATDLSRLVGHVREAVIFGPGDIAFAHAPDERVAVTDIETATRCLIGLMDRLPTAVDGGAAG